MKKIALPVLLIMTLLLTACGGSDDQVKKLDGKWGVDVQASMSADASLDGLSADEKKMALELAEGMLSAITIEFDTAQSKMNFMMGEHARSVDYTVESVSGKNVKLKTGNDIMNIEFKNDNSIIMAQEGDKTLVLKKK